MSTLEERQARFVELQKMAVDAVRKFQDAGNSVDVEELESLKFSRTYSDLIVAIDGMTLGLDIDPTPNQQFFYNEMRVISQRSYDKRRDIEAEGLGVDLAAAV
jgi:hypothetical protein